MRNEFADVVFLNGKIYTVDQAGSWVEAIAVRDEKIIAIGSNSDMVPWVRDCTQQFDLKGKMVLPGFIDSHAHPIMASFFKSGINFKYTMSLKEILDTTSKYVRDNPNRDVYFGQGYSEWLFDQTGPRKELLDSICIDKPLVLIGSGLHSAWCNSKALKLADITRDTPDPDPGAQYYRRDPDGTPFGSLVESGPIAKVVNTIKIFQIDDVQNELCRISKLYTAAGVTSINDGGIFGYMADEGRIIADKLIQQGKLKQRIRSCEFITMLSEAKDGVKKAKVARKLFNKQNFRVDYLKILNDGSSEACSCAMLEPFSDGTIKHPMLVGRALQNLCIEAAEAGMDIHIHGIGDRTIRETLDAACILREKGYSDTRIVNMHSIYIDPADLIRFAKYDVIANTTPVWFYNNPTKIKLFGPVRAGRTFPVNSLYNSGARVTFSSDFPADEYGIEPLKGIEMGITRQLYGMKEGTVLPPLNERMTVHKMIEGYTINAAYQMHMENDIGSIEPGKFADFVVLDKNLFDIDPHEIHNVKVLMTVFGGKVCYKDNIEGE